MSHPKHFFMESKLCRSLLKTQFSNFKFIELILHICIKLEIIISFDYTERLRSVYQLQIERNMDNQSQGIGALQLLW